MWRMLQQPEPDDYVVASGESHTVREFAELAFGYVGLDSRQYVDLDPRYYRPAEVDYLMGDASKARRLRNLEPQTHFEDLVRIMVESDLRLLENERMGSMEHGRRRRSWTQLARCALVDC